MVPMVLPPQVFERVDENHDGGISLEVQPKEEKKTGWCKKHSGKIFHDNGKRTLTILKMFFLLGNQGCFFQSPCQLAQRVW